MFGMDGSLNRPYSLSFFCKTFFLKPNSPLYDGRIIDASYDYFIGVLMKKDTMNSLPG